LKDMLGNLGARGTRMLVWRHLVLHIHIDCQELFPDSPADTSPSGHQICRHMCKVTHADICASPLGPLRQEASCHCQLLSQEKALDCTNYQIRHLSSFEDRNVVESRWMSFRDTSSLRYSCGIQPHLYCTMQSRGVA